MSIYPNPDMSGKILPETGRILPLSPTHPLITGASWLQTLKFSREQGRTEKLAHPLHRHVRVHQLRCFSRTRTVSGPDS